MQRIGRRGVVLAISKPLVAFSHVRVGNQGQHPQCGERGEIRFAVVARVRREYRRACAHRREGLDDRQQQLLLGARAMCLCVNDDLMFRIHGGDAGIALDDAFVGRHLRALVVRAIAFAQAAGGAVPIRRMRREPLT